MGYEDKDFDGEYNSLSDDQYASIVQNLKSSKNSVELTFHDLGEHMAVCLGRLNVLYAENEQVSNLEEIIRKIRASVTGVILGFQIGDIIRQRLEHIELSLKMLQNLPGTQNNLQRDVKTILHLQLSHLKDITGSFDHYIRGVEKVIFDMADEFIQGFPDLKSKNVGPGKDYSAHTDRMGAIDSVLDQLLQARTRIPRLRTIHENLARCVEQIVKITPDEKGMLKTFQLDIVFDNRLRAIYTMDVERRIHDQFFGIRAEE